MVDNIALILKISTIRRYCSLTLVAAGIALLAAPAGAQALVDEVSAVERVTSISRTESPPTIDGVLDDAAWADAAVVDDFRQINPREFEAPSEKTEVYLLYDADAIYIGARMYDRDLEAVTANTLRQGASLRWDDRLKVILDTFNNKRSGFEFEANSNGVRGAGLYKGDQVDRDWDGIYDVGSQRDEQGWTLEMRIPFKTLSFTGEGDWGFNLVRVISRRQETISWAEYRKY